jgi:ElaB/YqjD/DUF883 family membrane-anchored ribosome-binding protein
MANTQYPGTANYPGTTTDMGAGSEFDTESSSQGVKDRISGMTSQARDKAAELGRNAADTIDRNLDKTAHKLQNTAESLRMRAGVGEDRLSHLATTTADKLDATARYFRDHHTRDMVSGVESMARKNPGASLCAALAVGFLLGMALKRDRY